MTPVRPRVGPTPPGTPLQEPSSSPNDSKPTPATASPSNVVAITCEARHAKVEIITARRRRDGGRSGGGFGRFIAGLDRPRSWFNHTRSCARFVPAEAVARNADAERRTNVIPAVDQLYQSIPCRSTKGSEQLSNTGGNLVVIRATKNAKEWNVGRRKAQFAYRDGSTKASLISITPAVGVKGPTRINGLRQLTIPGQLSLRYYDGDRRAR